MLAVDDDYAGEAEVDTCAKEAGCDCEADEISVAERLIMWTFQVRWSHSHQKGIGKERVVMHLDSGNVANDFENFTADESCQECPSAVANAQAYLYEKNGGQDHKVEGIAAERRNVTDCSPIDRASLKGAEIVICLESCVCIHSLIRRHCEG